MKLLFDEGLSPKLVDALADLFPDSQTALRNGLARQGDRAILAYAIAGEFVLVTTDSDFAVLVTEFPAARVVVLRACNYPTSVAADVLRRNAIWIAALPGSEKRLLVLDR